MNQLFAFSVMLFSTYIRHGQDIITLSSSGTGNAKNSWSRYYRDNAAIMQKMHYSGFTILGTLVR